jgi:hypothetical protein
VNATAVNWKDVPRETTRITGEPRGPPTDLRLSAEDTVELPPYHYALVFER